MFKLFGKKEFSLLAPVDGTTVSLSQVPDKVFSQKLAGDGIALNPTSDVVKAPADGILTLLFKTNHAFGMTLENGIELIIHLGIDTVELKGTGFERIAQEGSFVNAGTPIIRFDREIISSKGISLLSPVLIANMGKVAKIRLVEGEKVRAGVDPVIYYTLK